jgi:hypothetical protein
VKPDILEHLVAGSHHCELVEVINEPGWAEIAGT